MQHHSHLFIKNFLLGILVLSLCSTASESLFAQQVKTYKEAITKGNENLRSNKLYDAKAYFRMALGFRTDDAYAKGKIQEIIQKLKGNENLEGKYYNIIDRADVFLENDAFEPALEAYRSALKLIPKDEYALKKINEINHIQTEEKQKLANYRLAMQKGDALLSQQQFQQAIDAFTRAQHFYPKKLSPANKIRLANQLWAAFKSRENKANKEVEKARRYLLIRRYDQALIHYLKADSLLPDQASLIAKINQLRPMARRQAAYNKVAAEADKLYISKNYMAAKMKYQEAAKLWPESNYPGEMLNQLEQRIALQRKDLAKNYQLALHQADSLFQKQEMANAKAQYQMALNLKPHEPYPNQQMKLIDDYLKKEQKKAWANYALLLKHADSLLTAGDLLASRDEFDKALIIKPGDDYPKKRLKEIDQKLIAEAQKKKELDDKYGTQIVLATGLREGGRLDDAKIAFENAHQLKPSESLPDVQIREIDSLIHQKALQAKIELAYMQAMQKGNDYLSQKAYKEAITTFQKAGGLKPEESLPSKKIQAIKSILAAIEQKKQIQQAYDESIAKAEQLLKAENYELAKSQFEKALIIKAYEAYPKQKINYINSILARLEKEKQQRYSTALSKADNYFNKTDYREALSQYKVAQSIKPTETYTENQINACKRALAVILQQQQAAYLQAIADADKLYAAKIFDKAIQGYERALQAMPNESYPTEMIQKITRYIEENAVVDIVKDTVSIAANQTRKFAFKPVRVDVRKSNYVLVKAQNVDGKSFKIIFTYGKGNAKNGGFVVQVPKGKASHDFIIRIGNQYKWFSQDNNWFSIYPDNNPIEVHLVRISKSN